MTDPISPQPHIPTTAHAPDEAEKMRALPFSLAQGGLNAIFCMWSFSGSFFLLFMSEMGLPKEQIGVLLSLFPFCGLLALFAAPLAARMGRKRLFLIGYGARKIVFAGLLLLPWLLAQAGRPVTLVFLFTIIVIFALLRALAETAFYPWFQEFVPNAVRGKYGAVSTVISTLVSCLALMLASYVIGHGTGLGRFMGLLGAGCAIGVVGVAMMWWVPGGAPIHETAYTRAHLTNLGQALRDGNFLAYLLGMGAVTIGSMLLTSFLPLYAREQLGVSSGHVILLDTATMLGGIVSSILWGVAADRVGSRPVLMTALTLTLLIPLGWLLLPRAIPAAVFCCGALYFLYGVASNGTAISTGRWLYNSVIPPEHNTAYTAIQYAWAGVTGGVAPIFAGVLLTRLGGWRLHAGPVTLDNYALLFVLSLLLLLLGWRCYRRVRPDGAYTTRAMLQRVADDMRLRLAAGRKPA